jgi:hypothetical protein
MVHQWVLRSCPMPEERNPQLARGANCTLTLMYLFYMQIYVWKEKADTRTFLGQQLVLCGRTHILY